MPEPDFNIKPHDAARLAGAKKKRRRVGRGHGSGRGKTSGRGTKGAGSRAGNRRNRRFEGGQTPIMMRSPKLGGFSNYRFRSVFEPINVGLLEKFEENASLGAEELMEAGLVRSGAYKILGDGELSKKLTIRAPRFSKTAILKIEAAGGTAVVVDPATGEPEGEERAGD